MTRAKIRMGTEHENYEALKTLFLYYAEVQLATLEMMRDVARPAKYKIERQEKICYDMVRICHQFDMVPDPREEGRVLEKMQECGYLD